MILQVHDELVLEVPEEEVDLPQEDTERLKALAKEFGYENLLRLLHHLLNSEVAVRRSEAGILALEIAWLRAAELPKLTRIETLLGGGNLPKLPLSTPAEPTAIQPPPSDEPVPSASDTEKVPSREPQVEPATHEVPEARTEPELDNTPQEEGGSSDNDIRRFLDLVSQRKQPLAAHLEGAERLAYADGELAIYSQPNDTWLSNALGRKSNCSILDECSKAVWGESSKWRLRESKAAAAQVTPNETKPDPALAHPTVQTALDIFGGTAQTVASEESNTN